MFFSFMLCHVNIIKREIINDNLALNLIINQADWEGVRGKEG